jgi:hypothetical protein
MTSKVKRRTAPPSFFDLAGHGFLRRRAQIPSETERLAAPPSVSEVELERFDA